jgi:hypothetical protein
MTRAEHLAWCKQRAIEYVDRGDVPMALASMLSDLTKHEETLPLAYLTGLQVQLSMIDRDPAAARRFIERFK